MPNNKKIDTPSSFWGIGGMALTLLSLAATVLLVATAGAVIGGLVVGLLGFTAGLVCMSVGIYKNNSAIQDLAKTNEQNLPQLGNCAEKQKTIPKGKQDERVNIKNDQTANRHAYISKENVNKAKNDQMSK